MRRGFFGGVVTSYRSPCDVGEWRLLAGGSLLESAMRRETCLGGGVWTAKPQAALTLTLSRTRPRASCAITSTVACGRGDQTPACDWWPVVGIAGAGGCSKFGGMRGAMVLSDAVEQPVTRWLAGVRHGD